MSTESQPGAVTGGVRTLLRVEGFVLLAGMTSLYALWQGSWWVYALLFLVPDLSFLAYLAGPRRGAFVYNAMHSYIVPSFLMSVGFALQAPLLLSIAMIWLAHIGLDRMLGFGLKYSTGFGITHLGRVGQAASGPS